MKKINTILSTIVIIVSLALGSSLTAQKYTGLTAVASDGGNTAGMFDGNTNGGQWQDAGNTDDGWVVVDLGSSKDINSIKIYWEAANAKAYNLSFSDDNATFTNLLEYTNMTAGNRIDNIKDLSITARYIKMQGVERQMVYGYCIFEFEVYAPFVAVLTDIGVSAPKNSVKANELLQLSIVAYDQTGSVYALEGNETINWSVDFGANITSSGVFSSDIPGVYEVKAEMDGLEATMLIEVNPDLENLALDKTYSASSVNYPVAEAFDGNIGTRWASANEDPQWIKVDLEDTYNIKDIIVRWETANAKKYKIEYSLDDNDWSIAFDKDDMSAGERVDRFFGLNITARYIRLTATEANTGYGYSIWEFEVYGQSLATSMIKKTNEKNLIYFNPSNGWLNIEIGKVAKAEIFSLGGELLLVKNFTNNTKIDLTNFGKGVYIVKVSTDSEVFTNKIIIN